MARQLYKHYPMIDAFGRLFEEWCEKNKYEVKRLR